MNGNRQADISAEAARIYDELTAAGIEPPRADNIESFRQQIRSAGEPYVTATLADYEIEIGQIDIAGLNCRQQTPPGWSEREGICILYAYGGGYVTGSSHEDQVISVPLASYSQARVISVDYRLSPEYPYPAAQQDMMQVYLELLQQYGAERLVVSGESAGGNQAVGLLQRARDQGLELPRCTALFSPWVDLTNQGDSHSFNDSRDPTLNNAWVDSAAAMHAADTPLDDPGISPLFGSLHELPPCIVTSGSRDLLLSQCLRLAQKLSATGVECDLRVWEGMWHVFEFYPIPEADRSLREVSDFIRNH